jgi:hypothetical protein
MTELKVEAPVLARRDIRRPAHFSMQVARSPSDRESGFADDCALTAEIAGAEPRAPRTRVRGIL